MNNQSEMNKQVAGVIRRRDKALIAVSFLPLLFLLNWLFPDLTKWIFSNEIVAAIIIFGWFGIYSALTFYWAFARCPSCEGLFYWKYWFYCNCWVHECYQCGLRVLETPHNKELHPSAKNGAG